MAWKDQLKAYISSCNQFQNDLESKIDLYGLYTHSNSLLEQTSLLCTELDKQDWKTIEGTDKEVIECLIYRWSIDALDISILLRDTCLKTSKNHILALCKGEEKTSSAGLSSSFANIISQALSQNLQLIDEIQNLKSGVNPAWFHQIEPTKEVNSQVVELKSQLKDVVDAHEKLKTVVPDFNKYREYLMDYSNARLLRLRSLNENIKEAGSVLNNLKESVNRADLTDLSKQLQDKTEKIESEKIMMESFEPFKSGTGMLKIPVHADGGEMIFKEISIDKKLESWTEDQLFPKLYDADLDIKSLYDNSLITLFNTRNKIESLTLNEGEDFKVDKSQLTANLNEQIKAVEEYALHLDEEVNLVNRMVNEQLQASKIYDLNSVFLPELNFTNITKIANQRLWYKPNFWSAWVERSRDYFSTLKIPFIKGIQQDAFSFVEERVIDAKNLDANSLFLKKGYLGRSFYVQRPSKEQTIIKAVKRWKKSYQGSVLLVGRRGSGKSSLIEFIPQLLDDTKVVNLTKMSLVKLNGRKHQVSNKIGETINFLAAQSINKPIIACIDDLESWQDDEVTMYDTIRELTDGISKYGKRIFFLISTNHFMHNFINRMFDFDSRFAEVVKMDGMPSQSIIDALVVRHNASLKNVELEENISLAQRASRIVAQSRSNIGASMMAWERYIEKKVKMGMPPVSFSKLIAEHHLLLKIVLTHGSLKENSLRKALTSSDNNFLSEEVRKLIGFKILDRTFDGYLEVNPFLIDEVEYVLLKENN